MFCCWLRGFYICFELTCACRRPCALPCFVLNYDSVVVCHALFRVCVCESLLASRRWLLPFLVCEFFHLGHVVATQCMFKQHLACEEGVCFVSCFFCARPPVLLGDRKGSFINSVTRDAAFFRPKFTPPPPPPSSRSRHA